MGFRFQKRIKLGKNFGVNLSKSGLSPSYRTKRGSLSTKGYSIKTGIKGVTYRKTFKKGGCILTLTTFFCLGVAVLMVSCKKENSSNNSLNQNEVVKLKEETVNKEETYEENYNKKFDRFQTKERKVKKDICL